MKTFTQDELKEILKLHGMWLRDEEGGAKADLRSADLRSANLRFASLRFADLRSADLRFADLRFAIGQNNWIKTLGTDIWDIVYTHDRMQIGCESHPIAEWWAFDDKRISKMDIQALKFWNRWKPILQAIIQNKPAQPTGKEQL